MSFYKEYCHTYNGYGKDLCHTYNKFCKELCQIYITSTRYEVIWSHNDYFTTALGKNGKKGHIVANTFNKNSRNKRGSHVISSSLLL